MFSRVRAGTRSAAAAYYDDDDAETDPATSCARSAYSGSAATFAAKPG